MELYEVLRIMQIFSKEKLIQQTLQDCDHLRSYKNRLANKTPPHEDRQNKDGPWSQRLNYTLLKYPGDCPSGM